MKLKQWFALALIAGAGACEDSTGRTAELLPLFTPGAYSLVSIGGKALPTPEPCSGLRADSERFTLRADQTVEWVFRLTHTPTGKESIYVYSGTYQVTGDGIVKMTLTGTGATAPFEKSLRVISEGLSQEVGTTCGEPASTKLYRL